LVGYFEIDDMRLRKDESTVSEVLVFSPCLDFFLGLIAVYTDFDSAIEVT
jgi:hypothetical protein